MSKKMLYAIAMAALMFGFTACNSGPTEYITMPTGEQFDTELARFQKSEKLGEDPEYFSISYVFKDMSNPIANLALLTTDVYNAESGELTEYTFSMTDHRVTGRGKGVTLTSGYGKNAEEVTDYDEFSHVLFTRADFPSAAKLNELYTIAVQQAKNVQDASVIACAFSKNGEPDGLITIAVGEKGSNGTKKGEVYFDAQGNLLKSKF